MKYIFLAGIVLLIVISPLSAEPLQTGVVQFEEKNDIGVDNAGVIVPEILVSYLKKFGEYTLSERVLLKKVLEEQALQLSGIIDEDMAGEVGKLFGLEAIVTGSIMKVGENITISGRVIKTESGEIVASGTIKFTDINEMEENLEELAYLLSGFTEDDYKKLKVSHEISKSNWGVRFGAGYAQNHNDNGFSGLLLSLFYQGEIFNAEFNAIPPMLGNTALINPVISVFPFTHVGFGASFIFCNDELSKSDKDVIGEDHYHGQYMSVLFGINIRATNALRGSIYMGPRISTYIDYQDESNICHEYTGGFLFKFPPPAITLDAEYCFPNNMSLKFMFVMASGEGEYEGHNKDMMTTFLILTLGYKFSL
jgi:hypothetical protein